MNVICELRRDHIQLLAKNERRADGRALFDHRPLVIEGAPIETAEGSCRVSLGDTDLLVGVKFNLGEPYDNSPEEGVLTTNAELNPLASPNFEVGPPREPAIELARVVDRGIRESGAISLEELYVTPGEKVWILHLDIHILDYDGNLFDAASIGALGALMTTTIPNSRYGLGEDRPLSVHHYPLGTTIAKIGETLMVDPNLEEEQIANTRLTIITDETDTICALQIGLGGALTMAELSAALDIAASSNRHLRDRVRAAIDVEGRGRKAQ